MGRRSVGAIVAVGLTTGLLGACSPSSSDSADTLPPLAESAAPITAAVTTAVPTTVPTTTAAPTTTVVYDAVAISSAFGTATVRVLGDQCGASSGTGLVLDDRHVVTSRAAIDGDATPTVITRDGRTLTATLIGQALDVDVAVLRTEPGTFSSAVAWGDSATVVEGATLTLVGYPDPGDYDVLDVNVRSVFDDGSGFRLDDRLEPGQDGAPAFDVHGTVVAMASSLTGGSGTSSGDGTLAPAARVAAAAAAIVAAPTAPQTTCSGQPVGTVAPTTTPATTVPGDTTTTTSVPGTSTTVSGTTTTLPGPGTGEDAKGTWIMQLASSKASVATPAAIAAQVAEFEKMVSGVRTLRSNDWPKAYPTPDLVIFYVGGFANKSAVVEKCTALGLTVPDDCLARFLDG